MNESNPYNQDQSNPYAAPSAIGTQPTKSNRSGRPLTPMEILTSFEGRIPRSTFWLWSLIVGAVAFVAMFAATIGLLAIFGEESPLVLVPVLIIYVPVIYFSLAIQCKRWHDRNKSGWWSLIGLIPYIGGIWAFVECGCLSGTPGPNDYGADPLNGR